MKEIKKNLIEVRNDYFEPDEDTTNQCRGASDYLVKILNEQGYSAKRVFGSYHNPSDEWYEENNNKEPLHHYVVINDLYIADITADQFHIGEEGYGIILTDIKDCNYNYKPVKDKNMEMS